MPGYLSLKATAEPPGSEFRHFQYEQECRAIYREELQQSLLAVSFHNFQDLAEVPRCLS
jgi:hypothetical protein